MHNLPVGSLSKDASGRILIKEENGNGVGNGVIENITIIGNFQSGHCVLMVAQILVNITPPHRMVRKDIYHIYRKIL